MKVRMRNIQMLYVKSYLFQIYLQNKSFAEYGERYSLIRKSV